MIIYLDCRQEYTVEYLCRNVSDNHSCKTGIIVKTLLTNQTFNFGHMIYDVGIDQNVFYENGRPSNNYYDFSTKFRKQEWYDYSHSQI